MRVLVVLPELFLRRFFRNALLRSGYSVLTAGTAQGALAAEPPDVVLLKPSLPDMSGAELVARLREVSPELGVLFVSGARFAPPELPNVAFLEMPVGLAELLVALEKLGAKRGEKAPLGI